MKITVLVENTTDMPDMFTEHGLSLYIETDKHKILFDTGQTDLFVKNARSLGIDLNAVDIAILSHGHYDHGGGLLAFLELNDHASIYMSRYAFEPHFGSGGKYVGIDEKIKLIKNRIIFTGEEFKIDDELTLYSCNEKARPYKMDNFGLNIVENGQMMPEDFRHEQYLEICLNNDSKKGLVSGCSHKGILNIMHWFAPDILVGGFHFMKLNPESEDKEVLRYAAEILNTYQTIYYTGHCTGMEQYKFLKALMGEQLNYMSTGMAFEV